MIILINFKEKLVFISPLPELITVSEICFSGILILSFNSFPKRQILHSSKLKEFADDNFKFNENGRKFSERVESRMGNEEFVVSSNFSFSYIVFKRLVRQSYKIQGLCGKELPITTQSLLLTPLRKKPLENIVGKRGKCW